MCKTHTLFAQQVAYNSLFGNEPIAKNNSLGLATYGLVKVEGLVTAANDTTFTLNISNTVPEYQYYTATGATPGYFTGQTFDLGGQQKYVGKNVAVYLHFRTRATTSGNGNFLAASVEPDRIVKVYSSELTEIEGYTTRISHNGQSIANRTTRGNTNFMIELAPSGVEYFFNEVQVTAAHVAMNAAVAKTGTVVTFVDVTGDNRADVVNVIEYTASTVTSYNSAGDGRATFSAFPRIDNKDWTSLNVVGFEYLSKDDVVYGYVVDKTLKVFVADRVEGILKVVNGTNLDLTIDSTVYKAAHVDHRLSGTLDDGNLSDTVEIYRDANGYYIQAKVVEGSVKPILIINGTPAGVSLGTQDALAVFTDGTQARITISKTDKKLTDSTATPAIANTAYSYTVENGMYELTLVPTAAAVPPAAAFVYQNNAITGVTFVKGQAAATAGSVIFVGNSNTVYVDMANNKAYTGFTNVPSMTAAGTATVVFAKDGYAQTVFIKTGTLTDPNSTKFVIGAPDVFEVGGTASNPYRIYNAIVNGEITKVYTTGSQTASSGLFADTSASVGYYVAEASKTQDGHAIITSVVAADTKLMSAAGTASGMDSSDTSVLRVGSTAYTVTDATNYFTVEFDSDITTSKQTRTLSDASYGQIENGDTIIVQTAGSTGSDAFKAVNVYIFKDVNAIPAVTYTATLTYTPATVTGTAAGTSATPVLVVTGSDSSTPTPTTVVYSMTNVDVADFTAVSINAGTGVVTTTAEPTNIAAQTFTVTATITLPSGTVAPVTVTITLA